MKAKGIARIVKLFAGTHIFPGSPFFIGKGVFHLVSVVPYIFGTKNRRYLRQFDFCNTLESIGNLLLLEFQLFFIWKMLPFASAAYCEMSAFRTDTDRRGGDHVFYVSLRITVFFAVNLYVRYVTGCTEWNEDNYFVFIIFFPRHFGEGLTLGCNSAYFYISQNWLFLAFSSHLLS